MGPQRCGLEDCQIHVSDVGTEIATSAAPKQTALSSDEAFQIHLVDYAIQHRDQTTAPSPTRAFWPQDLRARLSARQLDRRVLVRVRKDGRAPGLYGDEACTRPVTDADLEAVRSDLRFLPAPAKGKPAESVVAMNLGQRPD